MKANCVTKLLACHAILRFHAGSEELGKRRAFLAGGYYIPCFRLVRMKLPIPDSRSFFNFLRARR